MRCLPCLLALALVGDAPAQVFSAGPRPMPASVTLSNITTRLATNTITAATNDCGALSGVNMVTVSNYPVLVAPGWEVLSQTTNAARLLTVWSNSSGVLARSVTDATAPYLSTLAEPLTFSGFRADTLAHAVWTNFVGITNSGRTQSQMWATYKLPTGWPDTPPQLAWATNSLIYGQPRWTALSQCQENQGFRGMVPMTAITRRHVYFRGHGTGSAGPDIKTNWHGKRVWFVSASNEVVQMTLSNGITRLQYAREIGDEYQDYSVAVLTEDLPASIETMAMGYYRGYKTGETTWTNEGAYFSQWPQYDCYAVMGQTMYQSLPSPYLAYNSTGTLFSGVQGYIGYWRGGDSGGAFLLPMPDGLVMLFGATTSGANELMQADLDTLTTSIGLTTNNYQITYYDFTPYPDL